MKYNSRNTPDSSARTNGAPGFSRTAAERSVGANPNNIDWNSLRGTYLAEPTGRQVRDQYRASLYQHLRGAAIAAGHHDQALAELQRLRWKPQARRGPRAHLRSNELDDASRDYMETLSPRQAARYAAATYRLVLRPHEQEAVMHNLQRDPNYLANRVSQHELDNGADHRRAREINRMRARWELEGNLGHELSNSIVHDEDVDRAMSMWTPRNLDQAALQPWEHPTGAVANPMQYHLQNALRRHHFENGDALLPLTADLYRRVPAALHGGVEFPVFHHAVQRHLEEHNYKTERPLPPPVQIEGEELTRGFSARPDVNLRELEFRSPKTPARPGKIQFGAEGDVKGALWGPVWTAENRPTETKARAIAEMGRWLEDEHQRRDIDVHPLAHELYRPSWAIKGDFPHGNSGLTPNPDFYDTHLTRDFDLPFVVRTFDPEVDASKPWHQRLRTSEWTEDEPRGEGFVPSRYTRRPVPALLPFDTELKGRKNRVATFGELYHNPHMLVHDTAPVGTMFRDEKVDSGTLSLPVHVMRNGKRVHLDSPTVSDIDEYSKLPSDVTGVPLGDDYSGIPHRTLGHENPRVLYRVWNPGELATQHHLVHGNELYGHIYKLLADPRLNRDSQGRISWTKPVYDARNPDAAPGRVRDEEKHRLVSESMDRLQNKMYNLSRGRTENLVDGSEFQGHNVVREHEGFADSLQRLVIPLHPEDTERGKKLLRGLRGVAMDNSLRGLVENVGSPATNVHLMGPVHDWKTRFNQAMADNPDDPSLKLLHEGLRRFVPDFMGPAGFIGKENKKNRDRDARVIVSDVSGDIRRRSIAEDYQHRLREMSETGDYEMPGNDYENEEIPSVEQEEQSFGGQKL